MRNIIFKSKILKDILGQDKKEYIYMLRERFPDAIITREFYKGSNVLVRATEINTNKQEKNKDELEREEVRIKEKGINGLGKNVYRDIGKGRERGSR